MELFLRLFNTGISLQLFIITFLIAISASACLYYKRYKQVLLPWIMACLFLMLYTTVIGRLVNGVHETASLQIIPFWSVGAIQDGYIETFYEKIYNVLFFVPYGFLLGLNGSNSSKGSKGMKGAVLIGFLTSVIIELLQLITRTGTCETDDVICNTLGCAIGAVIGVGIYRMIDKIRNK